MTTSSPASRILLLAPRDFRLPRDGGAMRDNAVFSEIASRHDVDFVTVDGHTNVATSDAPAVNRISAWLQALGIMFRVAAMASRYVGGFFNLRTALALHRLKASGRYAVTLVEHSYLTIYSPVLPGSVVVDLHNIESELKSNVATSKIRSKDLRTRLTAPPLLRDVGALRRIERTLPAKFSRISVVSCHDRQHLLDLAGADGSRARIAVAHNGVDESRFSFEGERSPTVVFVAHLGWDPNVDGAVWLAARVWPLILRETPTAKLQLIGRTPSDRVLALQTDSIEVHADVSDVVPFVGHAKVATAPLLAAGGTRLKILEALACGTPVVSTTMGALGLEHMQGGSLAIADDPEHFAREVIRYLRFANYPRADARAQVTDYRWSTTLRGLINLVDEAASDCSVA